MRAVMAAEPGKLALGELPIPTPGEFQALVRMDACAICNSTDHKLLYNEFCPGPFPTVLGHEVIGTVVEVGPKTVNFTVGDRVFRQRLFDEALPAGIRSTWGGFAEYGIVTDRWASECVPYGQEHLPHDQQKLLIDVSPALASGMVTLMEALDATIHTGLTAGQSVAIVGAGPVGQAYAVFARLLGAGPVYVFGRRALWQDRLAAICRCDGYVIGDEFPADVRRIIDSGGFDIVIEAAGSADALTKGIQLAGVQGTVFVYGVAPESRQFASAERNLPNVKTLGAVEGRSQAQLVRLVESGALRLEDWVSHVFPLTEYQQAFTMVERKESLKAVLTP